MYPYLKLIVTLMRARFEAPLEINEAGVIYRRAGLTDIDMFAEVNNARFFHLMELGRWNYMYRTGLLKLLREQRWGIAVGGASIRYRRRIPFLSRYSLTTQLLCHDGRWFYFLQETHRGDAICTSALMKVGATSKGGLVEAREAVKLVPNSNYLETIPAWVTAWMEAEGQRPWPSASGKP